jgi:hypothetical protein
MSSTRWISWCLVALWALPVVAGSKVLVAPSSPWELSLRTSCALIPDVEVASPEATLGLVDDARSVGLTCPANDAACWLRIAVLGGYDQALLLVDDRVVLISATATQTTAIDRRESEAFTAAIRRLFKLEGAVRIVVQPELEAAPKGDRGAVRSLDGAPVGSGIVDGVAAGPHRVVVVAPGFSPAEADVVVVAGEVAEVTVTLTPGASTPSPTSFALGPILWWTGVGTLALGAVVGVPLIIAGETRYAADGCGPANNTGPTCGQGGTSAVAAQSLSGGGLGVAVVAAIVGGALLITGAVIE